MTPAFQLPRSKCPDPISHSCRFQLRLESTGIPSASALATTCCKSSECSRSPGLCVQTFSWPVCGIRDLWFLFVFVRQDVFQKRVTEVQPQGRLSHKWLDLGDSLCQPPFPRRRTTCFCSGERFVLSDCSCYVYSRRCNSE